VTYSRGSAARPRSGESPVLRWTNAQAAKKLKAHGQRLSP
jgi:hypothetical protein